MAESQKPTLLQIIASVLAALFGVQSNKARMRDFQHGNAWIFIIMGLVAVILFVLTIYGVVSVILTINKTH